MKTLTILFLGICLFVSGICSIDAKNSIPPKTVQTEYKYDLSICVVFQNEAPFLKEWIEYHKMLGVDHFYCFNHYSTDNYLEVLKPYIDEGTVELKDIKTIVEDFRTYYAMQCKCYTDCLRNARGISKWVAFIDPDEFLLPVQDISLKEFLKDYEGFGGIAANWMMFGTSNLKKIPEDKLLIESLVSCSRMSFVCNMYVKSIVRPERASHFENAHQPVYLDEYLGVNTNGFSFDGDKSYQVLWDRLRINHYWTRDEDFFYKIKMGRQIKFGGKPNPEQLFRIMNASKDDLILRYVPELRKRMGFK